MKHKLNKRTCGKNISGDIKFKFDSQGRKSTNNILLYI